MSKTGKKKVLIADKEPTAKKKAPIAGGKPTAKKKAPIAGGEPIAKKKAPIAGGEPTAKKKAPIAGDEPTAIKEAPIAGDEPTTIKEAPIVSDEPTTIKKAPIVSDGPNARKKVLIADDEPTVRQLVHRMLNKDYAVIEAENGGEAVDMARNHKPDIILMDIMMPKMDGLTACYTIKSDQTTKEIPVLMLTAIGHDLNKKLSEDIMGADGYITKPFNSKELLQIIKDLLFNSKTRQHVQA